MISKRWLANGDGDGRVALVCSRELTRRCVRREIDIWRVCVCGGRSSSCACTACSTGVAFLCEVCGTLPGAGVTVGGSKLAQQRGTVMKRGGGS